MLKSIALIMLIGMSAGWICRKVKLPGLLGMLFTGIILGPLIFRMAGVALCMAGTKLKLKEGHSVCLHTHLRQPFRRR